MRRDLVIILQMGLAFAFIFSAFNSQGLIEVAVLRKLAEISPETGITVNSGYYSLSIIYFVFTLSNLMIPPVVKKMGSKWSQVCGATCYFFFMLTFLYLNAALLYLGSAVLGFGAALLWTGNGSYLIDFSRNGKLSRNSGILWAMLQSSLITGAFFLIYILSSGDLISSYKLVYTVFSVISGVGILLLILLPSYPPQYGSEENLVQPVAVEEENSPTFSIVAIREQFSQMFALLLSTDMLTLAVSFLYTGFEMTFYTGVYTACLSATNALSDYADFIIPYNALALGVGQIAGGLFNGPIGKILRLERPHFVLIGMVGHIVAFFICFLMLPFDSTIHKTDMITYINPTLFLTLVVAFLLGICDACWQTQIYVILGDLYKFDSVNAFAIYKFFQSMAACISFYYSAYLLLHWQLLILTVGSFLSTIFFLRLEYNFESAHGNQNVNQ